MLADRVSTGEKNAMRIDLAWWRGTGMGIRMERCGEEKSQIEV